MCDFVGRVDRATALATVYKSKEKKPNENVSNYKLGYLYTVFQTGEYFKKIPNDFKANKKLYNDGETLKDRVKIFFLDAFQVVQRIVEALAFFFAFLLRSIVDGVVKPSPGLAGAPAGAVLLPMPPPGSRPPGVVLVAT